MTISSIERGRTESLQGLFDGLLQFSRSLRSRAGDWTHAVRDLSRGDIIALGVIERRDSTRPGQIAAALGVDPSVVSRQLATLDRLGLIARSTDPLDRRAELITATDLGRERLQQARAAMCEALADRLTGWTPEEIARAAGTVHELADALQDNPHTRVPHDIPAIIATADSKDAHA
jgi:DNA-binding MarR family transcriptional regulator